MQKNNFIPNELATEIAEKNFNEYKKMQTKLRFFI